MPNEISYKDYPDGTRAYFRDDTARGGVADINTALTKKLTLVEHKKTTTGNNVTLDTTLQDSVDYLLSMGVPVTATGRRLRLSIISVVGGNLNEAGFGNSDAFTLSVSNNKITITSSDARYGVEASLIKLS